MKWSELNELEKQIGEEILLRGMERAAGSLSQLIKGEVKVVTTKVSNISSTHIGKCYSEKTFSSTLKGDLKGEVYISLTTRAVEELSFFCGQSVKNPELLQDPGFRESAVLELLNILVSSAVTQYSDLLDVSLYGHVLSYHESKIKEHEWTNLSSSHYVMFICELEIGSNIRIATNWFFNTDLLEEVIFISSEA